MDPYDTHSKVGPGGLQGWVVLLRVEVRVVTWRQRSKQVACDLATKNMYNIQPTDNGNELIKVT